MINVVRRRRDTKIRIKGPDPDRKRYHREYYRRFRAKTNRRRKR